MNENMKAFWEGCVRGAKEAPRGFFAPLIVLVRWMSRVSDEGMGPPNATFTLSPAAKKSLTAAAAQLEVSPALALELAIHQLHHRLQPVTHGGQAATDILADRAGE